jgi:beta-1,4-mannosyltransferase
MVRVLQSSSAPDGNTRYVDQLMHNQPDDIEFVFFSWDTALTSEYDVFHVHWPDALLAGQSPLRRWANRVRFYRLQRHLRAKRIPVVRTMHNMHPHESLGLVDQRLLSAMDANTDYFVRINGVTEVPAGKPGTTILHGHYVDRFSDHPVADVVAGRILNFGLMRRYKGIDRLIDTFGGMADPDVSLRLVGRVVEPDLGELVDAAVARDARITAVKRFVDDHELVYEVTSAELVVLPYSEMHNSGTLLVALSLGRPALVPRSSVNEAISREVGPGWVIQYDGPLEAAHLRAALAEIRAREASSPDLAERDWDRVTGAYSEVYRSLAAPVD